MSSKQGFSAEVERLAAAHGVITRLIQGRRTLAFTDGNDEWLVVGDDENKPGAAAEAFAHFRRLDQQRSQVINELRQCLEAANWQVETCSSGIWHCYRDTAIQCLTLDYRLTRALDLGDPTQVLTDLLRPLDQNATEEDVAVFQVPRPEGVRHLEVAPELIAARILQHTVLSTNGEKALKLSAPFLGRRSSPVLDAFPTEKQCLQLDQEAMAQLRACHDQRPGPSGETPHWSALWRMYQRDGHWFSSQDRPLTKQWLLRMAHRELAQGCAADTLSAMEVCMSFGERCCRERALDELALWQSVSGQDLEATYLLSSYFYDDRADVRTFLDAADSGWRDQTLIQQRHFPTMRRIAIEFTVEWQRCERGEANLAEAWVLEQENFRRMGPIWARDWLGPEALTRLQDACCQAARAMDAEALTYHLHNLVLWASEFYWLDVLSLLRQNRHLPSALEACQRHLATIALAWSSIRPDPLMAQIAIWLIRSERPLESLAGATVWRRCRLSTARGEA